MVHSRCWILLCIWVDASGQWTNVHHAGEQKARKALWVLLASETGVLNHRSRPCSCTPSSSCREQVDVGLAALHGAHGKRGRRRSGRCRLAPHGPGRAGKRERGCCWRQGCGRAAAPGREGLQTLLLPQPSGNSSALRWKRSWSKWGQGQYENGYNGIKIVAPASPPAGARL